MVKIKSLPQRISKALLDSSRSRSKSIQMKRSMQTVRAAVRASQPSTGAKNVRGVLVGGPQGPERKKYEVAQAIVGVSTSAPYVQSLTAGIAQGTAVNQRIGDRIHVKAVDLQFNTLVTGEAETGSTSTFLDVFLIIDTQPQETTAGANTIFQNSATNLTYIQLDSLERFQVLKRERIYFDSADKFSHVFTWHQSAELACRFGSSTSAPMSNDLLVCALSPNTAGLAVTPNISYISRLTFTDE